jgi:hypothetical protein
VSPKTCPRGHQMVESAHFLFDHEEGDTARDKDSLQWMEEHGVELGAEVTLWECPACDYAVADFHYSEQ